MNQRDDEADFPTCAMKPIRGDLSPLCAQCREIRFDFTDLGAHLQEAALRFIASLGDLSTPEMLWDIELSSNERAQRMARDDRSDIDELREAALAFRTQERIRRHNEWCSGADWLRERERERLRKCTMFAGLHHAYTPCEARCHRCGAPYPETGWCGAPVDLGLGSPGWCGACLSEAVPSMPRREQRPCVSASA